MQNDGSALKLSRRVVAIVLGMAAIGIAIAKLAQDYHDAYWMPE